MNLLYEDMHDTTYDDLQTHTKQIENPSISFDEYIANIKRGMGEGKGDNNPNPNPGSGGVPGNPGSGGVSGNSNPNPNPNHTPYTMGDDEKCSSKLGHTDPNKTTTSYSAGIATNDNNNIEHSASIAAA